MGAAEAGLTGRRSAIRAAVAADPEAPDREIARLVGCSAQTVKAERKRPADRSGIKDDVGRNCSTGPASQLSNKDTAGAQTDDESATDEGFRLADDDFGPDGGRTAGGAAHRNSGQRRWIIKPSR